MLSAHFFLYYALQSFGTINNIFLGSNLYNLTFSKVYMSQVEVRQYSMITCLQFSHNFSYLVCTQKTQMSINCNRTSSQIGDLLL